MIDIFTNLMAGFALCFEPLNLALIIGGAAIGIFVGAMPGLGSVNGVAILLPMTFLVPPTGAIIFLCALYYGAMYGGAISSIMLGIPGASTAVATVFDGRPLALKGKANWALVTAASGSFVGGTISVILFTIAAPPLAAVALKFGAPEEFSLMCLAFATFIGLGGEDVAKTFFSIFIGLAFACVGVDIISGEPRMIFFGLPGFYHGVNFLVLAIGIYGIGEMLWTVEETLGKVEVFEADITFKTIMESLKKAAATWKTMIMGSFLGYFVGVLPAAGATPGSLMAYGVAKSLSKEPETFGKGNLHGVAGPEAANNAASTGSMLPMLTLGIPGSPTTAILLGGMVIWGLEPGPMLFYTHKEFVWGLIAALYIANFFSALINLCAIPVFLWVLKLPFTILAPIIYILCLIGGYAPTQDLHDVWLMLIFGIFGYLLRKLDYPMAPAVLAIVLGPMAEASVRQSLLMSSGSFKIFFTRPASAVIMIIALLLFTAPLLKLIKDKVFPPRPSAEPS
ncbi:MAG: tripartite tricarboxylate transporter permease [Deltaproteobacteria bacterium]|nr:tripartite tricarboxylate transporter permease [Deltaproteobacteria bacterium]